MGAITSVKLGSDATFGVGAAGQTVPSGTFNDIGGLVSGSLSISTDAVDSTNNDDNGFTSMVPGNTTLTLSLEFRMDPVADTTGQATLEDIGADVDGGSFKALKAFRIRPRVGSGESEWSFDGHVTSYEVNAANNETVDVSIEIQSTGASTGGAAPVWSAQT